MDVWVQGRLFEGGADRPARGAAVGRRLNSARNVSVGWAPVTRDPAVAASHAAVAGPAGDVRIGLARSLDRLSPELRQAIRAAVSARRAAAA